MLLKAGALSLCLLVASRLLGLLRESALAATFGASGLADVAVLMLTLPDLLAGVLASGALAYVLLPAWVGLDDADVAATQRRIAAILLVVGIALALALVLLREPALGWLAGGIPTSVRPVAGQALVWSAAALPAALLAGLWTTRLQHQRDFLGMYCAGIVVNVVLLAVIAGCALAGSRLAALAWLGGGLVSAMALRLVWLRSRQPAAPALAHRTEAAVLPAPSVWLWAALAAGLPLALPFTARSLASQSGEGGLAIFNYAWKLVELPLMLAIQLVATLAFPSIAASLAGGVRSEPAQPDADVAVRSAFALAFALACACAAGLLAGAPALAQLLFGWGRMEAVALSRIAAWARIAAWGLPAQAVIAVALTVLASRQHLRRGVLAYVLALVTLLGAGALGVHDGGALMGLLDAVFVVVAIVPVFAMGSDARRWLPWKTMGTSLLALLLLAAALSLLPADFGMTQGLAAALLCGMLVLGSSWVGGARWRREPAP
jgi:putative peptidoglycan lipid II flippase